MPPLVSCFKIRPKFELDPRLIELKDGDTCIGLFMRVSTRWDIHASIDDLQSAGVELSALHVVRRNPAPEERRLVGKIDTISGGTIALSEAYDDIRTITTQEVWLEGNRASFSRCLKKLLGPRFADFEEQRSAEEAKLFSGPALDQTLNKMGEILQQASPIKLSQHLSCSITDRLELSNDEHYKTVVLFDPSEYCFDPAKTKRSRFAWPGLNRFGPYSRESFPKRSPRILIVCPDTVQGQVEQFLRLFRDGIVSYKDSRYSKGLAGTFNLVNPEFVFCSVPLLGSKQSPADLYRQSLVNHLATSSLSYDAALVAILDEQSNLADSSNPYLHTKAVLLTAGIPVQEARLSNLIKPVQSLQYILQNLSIAVYAKMGGVPWTVDHDLTVNDELVIGMGTAELSGSRFTTRQRHIGITTVFRGDGNYLLANLSKECPYEEYPGILRSSTLEVLREIKSRNGWRPGDTVRIVFHAPKPLRKIEVADVVTSCVQEVGREQNIQFAFLTVSHDHPFRLLDSSQKGIAGYSGIKKAAYVPERGLMAQLGRFTRLLCTNGPLLIKRPTSPLPTPLLIHLHPQSTYRDQTYLTEQVLKFTSLSWRSTLPAESPVTIYYSELIAGLLARLRHIPDWSPLMLNVKLRASRWFL